MPIKCIRCQKEGDWICKSCNTSIKILSEHFCGVCERVITPDGRTCLSCKEKTALDGLLPAVAYNEACICHAIHFFKYRYISDLHITLGKILVTSMQKTDLPLPDLIMAVPLHPKRLRWRGFNQSALLAEYVSKNLLLITEIPFIENILIRHRYTNPQMKINDYSSRKKNIAGAFSVIKDEVVKDKIILLIDDVSTTGTTIFECAKVLKIAGAKEIYASVIARQQTKHI